VIEVERNLSTVSGEITVEGSVPASFYGWLELIDQLDGALGRPDESRTTSTDRSATGESGPPAPGSN
jgi:hypothetical protein